MPSIPQSLLWISLVVLWLFVLVPMLINKRDAVRRTSDTALATRVLNGGVAARLLKRGGPAAGHRSDPAWQPEENVEEDADLDDDLDDDPGRAPAAVTATAVVDDAEPDYLDVEIVDEDSAALPAGDSAQVADDQTDPADEEVDQYEYVDDTSGLEPPEDLPTTSAPAVARRRRYDADSAAAIGARKYAFRRRVLMTMALVLVASATAAFRGVPTAWWVCGAATGVTLLYLGYLRRQTRIEERLRRRRMQRLARSRLSVGDVYDRDVDAVSSRLRRPGAAVLEIDDEDPMFEHLDYPPFARAYGWPRDLPRAAGQ